MNWKNDQIEKPILFYSHNSLFLVPNFWYQKSCNWYQILVPVFCYQFLVPVSGQYVMGISPVTMLIIIERGKKWAIVWYLLFNIIIHRVILDACN